MTFDELRAELRLARKEPGCTPIEESILLILEGLIDASEIQSKRSQELAVRQFDIPPHLRGPLGRQQ